MRELKNSLVHGSSQTQRARPRRRVCVILHGPHHGVIAHREPEDRPSRQDRAVHLALLLVWRSYLVEISPNREFVCLKNIVKAGTESPYFWNNQ
ncbi:MAG: hypothetical protein ACE5I5_18555 [Candidatus Heimdallarchaeota archaeon]